MSIAQAAKKLMFGSFEKNKLPNNLIDFTCELIIEEEFVEGQSVINNYLKFTPKLNKKGEEFIIMLDEFKRPKNLIYSFKIEGEKDDPKLQIEQKCQYKILSTVKIKPKKIEIQEIHEIEDDEILYPDNQVEIKVLELDDEDQNDSDSDSSNHSKGFQPSEIDKQKIKNQLIGYLNDAESRDSTLKDMRSFLKSRSFNISENRIKGFLSELCNKMIGKKTGYTLKDQFISKEFQRRAPKKKVKEDD